MIYDGLITLRLCGFPFTKIRSLHIPWSELNLVSSPFHGLIPRMQAYPLRQIDLHITFGDCANFHSEVLTFEVVDFLGSYHAILGRPCYAKFMAIPNYTYLKLKIPGAKRHHHRR